MRYVLSLKSAFIVVLCCLFFSSLGVNVINLDGTKQGGEIVLSSSIIEIFKDSTSAISINDIDDVTFITSDEEFPFNEDQSATYWVKFTCVNHQVGTQYMVDIHSPNARCLTLYKQTRRGFVNCGKTGLDVPLGERQFRDKNLLLGMTPGELGEPTVYLVKVSPGGFCRFNFYITQWSHFMFVSKTEFWLLGIFYGVVLIMVVYNLIMFWSLGRRVHLWYVLLMLGGAFKTLAEDRLGGLYVWPGYPEWSYYIGIHIAPIVILVGFVGYSIDLLSFKSKSRSARVIVLSIVPHLIFYSITLITVGDSVFAASLYFIPYATITYYGIDQYRKKYKVSWYFLLGCTIFLFTICIDELRHFRWVFGGLAVVFSFHITILVQAVVLSLSIFDQLKTLNQEKQDLVISAMKKEKLHYADQMRIKYFSDISHELKTHLTLILSPLSQLVKSDKSGVSKIQAASAYTNAQRVLRFVDQLITINKMEDHLTKPIRATGDLVGFTQDVVETFNPYALERKIDLNFKSNISHCLCEFDGVKIEKILFNLISNGIEHCDVMEAVDVELQFDKENKSVSITVSDSGRGIQTNDYKAIFSRYYQSGNEKGLFSSGIGLEFTHRLGEILGGSIEVESEMGKGSDFIVILPLYETKIRSIPKLEGETLPKMLIVEDNDVLRAYLVAELMSEFDVIEARHGEEGLRLMEKETPHIILTDMQMPVMDGLEFVESLRSNAKWENIPVIMLSVKADADHRSASWEIGVDAYISKPFRLDELRNVVQNLMSKQALSSDVNVNANETLAQDIISKARTVVLDQLDNVEFGVQEMCLELGVSRAQLYRKFRELKDISVKEFIR